MMSQTGTLWHYLGSFLLYTLLAIGMIYAAYWYMRKHSGNLFGLGARSAHSKGKLEIESVLALEARKNVYVVRAGQERFLLATSTDGTQMLSRLESLELPATPMVAVGEPVELPLDTPWYTKKRAAERQQQASKGIGPRLVQSVQWLMASRTRTI